MANELNFDELDQAVNNYMQKSDRDSVPRAADRPQQSTATARPVQNNTPSDSNNGNTSVTDRLQVTPRQTISRKTNNNRPSTFHDITPPARRSSTTVSRRLTPLNVDTTAQQSEAAETQTAQSQTPPQSSDPVEESTPVVTQESPTETVATTKESAETPPGTSPVVLGATDELQAAADAVAADEPAALPAQEEQTSTETPPVQSFVGAEVEQDAPTTTSVDVVNNEASPEVSEVSPVSSEDEPKVLQDDITSPTETAMSDPMLQGADVNSQNDVSEDATPSTNAVEDDDSQFFSMPIGDGSDADTQQPSEEKSIDFTSQQPVDSSDDQKTQMPTEEFNTAPSGLDLIEQPSPVEEQGGVEATQAMLEPGKSTELLGKDHEANQGGQGNGFGGPVPTAPADAKQVFDTKQYHTPIGSEQVTKDHQQMLWTWLIIFLGLVALVIAGFVIYTLFFATR